MSNSKMSSGTPTGSIRAPIVKQIEQLPLHTPGSLVWDSTSQSLFISTDTKWVTVSSSSSVVTPSAPTISSRAVSGAVQANTVQAFKFLQMPTVPSIATTPLQEPGGILLTADTKTIYYSTPTSWVQLGGTTVIASAGTGISLISSYTNPTYFLKSLVAGSGVTITPNFANTELTISSTGGGGGVTSIIAGNAISVTGPAATPTVSAIYSGGAGISIVGATITNTVNFQSEPFGGSVFSGVSTNTVNPATLRLKTFTAGTNIGIVSTGTNLTFNVTNVVLSVSAGTGISITGTATAPIINNTGVITLTAGAGISVTGTASNPIVTNTTQFSSELPVPGVSYSVVSSSTVNPTTLVTKTITAGSNINITSTGTNLTINSTAASSITGFGAMKSGTQTFNYVGPQPTGGVITGWSTTPPFNFDTSGGAFVPLTGVYTVATSGLYNVTANVNITPNTNQDSYYLILLVNGVTNAYRTNDQPASNVGITTTLRLVTNVTFTAADTVELVVSDSVAVIGSSFTVNASPDTWFSILKF